ncbi:hypothetical protein BUALT_Bualt03G0157100 [Buddleja alternifolia]|uniref:Trichome birefringence-like N-terminal domain-containing protein n=1 Tax=Buddleja alternifolia TaxID=168488 RepID=A0AAV6Y0X8_9LAMI|nr:hypothetical protein BUALT_Bualt03G0157100 [Buddleja alternifolia]
MTIMDKKTGGVGKLWKIKFKFHIEVVVLFLLAFLLAFLYVRFDINAYVTEDRQNDVVKDHEVILSNDGGCNLFSGRWVYDNISYPLYKEGECSFMQDEFACQEYGRKDIKYQHWRWQPHHCNLPRFNGTELLEKIRGKKVIFVGDSLNRNAMISMLCLLESSLPPSSSKSLNETDNFLFFEANEYNATIGFYWSPFLVESNGDHPHIHRPQNRVIRIKAIEKHARHWNDADILIFDSFVWWLEPKMTLLWGSSFESSDGVYKEVEMKPHIHEMALDTWSDWLEFNINRTKTKLFFMSLSPIHVVGENWDLEQNCYNQTEPILDWSYWGFSTDSKMMRIVESAIRKLGTRGIKVEYMNITQMSDYRRDGHPSIYKKFYHTITEEQLKDPRSYSDCIHWCLPGVPDVWNQIIYAYIMKS